MSEATFVFADIAGSTALTEAHGDEEAVAVVEEFAEAVCRDVPAIGREHVKTIGDAVMLHIPDPGDAILVGLEVSPSLSPSTPRVAWESTPAARPAGWCTRGLPISSARRRAPANSPARPEGLSS